MRLLLLAAAVARSVAAGGEEPVRPLSGPRSVLGDSQTSAGSLIGDVTSGLNPLLDRPIELGESGLAEQLTKLAQLDVAEYLHDPILEQEKLIAAVEERFKSAQSALYADDKAQLQALVEEVRGMVRRHTIAALAAGVPTQDLSARLEQLVSRVEAVNTRTSKSVNAEKTRAAKALKDGLTAVYADLGTTVGIYHYGGFRQALEGFGPFILENIRTLMTDKALAANESTIDRAAELAAAYLRLMAEGTAGETQPSVVSIFSLNDPSVQLESARKVASEAVRRAFATLKSEKPSLYRTAFKKLILRGQVFLYLSGLHKFSTIEHSTNYCNFMKEEYKRRQLPILKQADTARAKNLALAATIDTLFVLETCGGERAEMPYSDSELEGLLNHLEELLAAPPALSQALHTHPKLFAEASITLSAENAAVYRALYQLFLGLRIDRGFDKTAAELPAALNAYLDELATKSTDDQKQGDFAVDVDRLYLLLKAALAFNKNLAQDYTISFPAERQELYENSLEALRSTDIQTLKDFASHLLRPWVGTDFKLKNEDSLNELRNAKIDYPQIVEHIHHDESALDKANQ